MLSFPHEVIAEVFRCAVALQPFPSDHCNLANVSFPSNASPINLTLVCKGWRQIALSEPYLWSFMNVTANSKEDISRSLSRVRTWLQRSSPSSVPLTLDVTTPEVKGIEGDNFGCVSEAAICLFDQLDGHKHRWTDVTIRCCHLTGIKTLPIFKVEEFPVLESLRLAGIKTNMFSPGTRQHRLVILSAIPSIRTLVLDGIFDVQVVPDYGNLDNLTSVHLGVGGNIISYIQPRPPGVKACIEVFRCAPHLKEFSAEIGKEDYHPIAKDHFHHIHLQRLCISWHVKPTRHAVLLDTITAPSLKSLSISFAAHTHGEFGLISLEDIQSFVFRSNTSLTHLRINSPTTPLRILPILQTQPDLQLLDLSGYEILTSVSTGLQEKAVNEDGSHQFAICPRLASLNMQEVYCDCDALYYHKQCYCGVFELLDVIKKRWNVPASQRYLKAAGLYRLAPEDNEELAVMVEEGLEFSELDNFV